MKFLVAIGSFFFTFSSSGQELQDCRLLQASVESSHFKNRFYLCQDSRSIYLLDTLKSFAICNFRNVSNNEVRYVHSLEDFDRKNVIEIYRIDERKDLVTIYFHRPSTGAVLILKLKPRKKKVEVVGYESGAF